MAVAEKGTKDGRVSGDNPKRIEIYSYDIRLTKVQKDLAGHGNVHL